MTTWFYYDNNGQKQGPYTGGQLKGLAKTGRITPETMIETEEGKKASAGKVKGLTFVETAPSHSAPPTPQAVQPPPKAATPRQRSECSGEIRTYLVWSIFTTLCCNPLLGIPAIIFSVLCGSDLKVGNYGAAAKKSNIAFWCNIVGLILGLILACIQILRALLSPAIQATIGDLYQKWGEIVLAFFLNFLLRVFS